MAEEDAVLVLHDILHVLAECNRQKVRERESISCPVQMSHNMVQASIVFSRASTVWRVAVAYEGRTFAALQHGQADECNDGTPHTPVCGRAVFLE